MNINKFNFKKKFGQNFINDTHVINKIIEASDVDKDTLTIEVGAGSGILTKALCEKAGYVISYEIDKELEGVLEQNLKDYENFTILFKDFLKVDVKEEIDKHKYKKINFIANLPYYITTPIINKIINDKLPIDKIIIMIQKEVGDRFNGKPGTRSYNSLTVFLNYYYEITKVMDVSRNAFTPKPNVDSAVIELKRRKTLLELKNEEFFFKLVRDSFQFKRKNLRNNLRAYNLDKIQEVLQKYNLDLTVRAEQIPIEIFVELANNLM